MWRLTAREKQKYALVERFGLTEKLLACGWASLSAKEAGRIGGAMRGRKEST